MKKFAIFVLSILLCGCSSNVAPNTENKNDFIQPTNEVIFMDTLSVEDQEKLIDLNDGYFMDNTQFEVVGKELINFDLKDINGNDINLLDLKGENVLLEVVTNWCEFCLEQERSNNPEIRKNHPEIKMIQYFANGNKEDIEAFYTTIETEIPDDVIIIPENEQFTELLTFEYGINAFPSILSYDKNGEVSWYKIGLMDNDSFEKLYDIMFNEALGLDTLTNTDGKNYEEAVRSWQDVKNSFPNDVKDQLTELSHKNLFFDLGLYENYHHEVNITDKSIVSDITNQELKISDKVMIHFIDYREINNNFENFNKLMDQYPEYQVINVILSDMDSSEYDKEIINQLNGFNITGYATVPEDLYNIKIYNDPTIVKIENNIIEGVWSGNELNNEEVIKLFSTLDKNG